MLLVLQMFWNLTVPEAGKLQTCALPSLLPAKCKNVKLRTKTHLAAGREQQGAMLQDLVDAEALERQQAGIWLFVPIVHIVLRARAGRRCRRCGCLQVRGAVVLAVRGDLRKALARGSPAVPLAAAQPLLHLC